MVVPSVALVVAPWFRRRGASRPTTPREAGPSFVCTRMGFAGDIAELAARLSLSLQGAFAEPPMSPSMSREGTDGNCGPCGGQPAPEMGASVAVAEENDDQLYRDVDRAVWSPFEGANDVASMTGIAAVVLYVGTELSREHLDGMGCACSEVGLFGAGQADAAPVSIAVIDWQYELMPDGFARSRTPPAFRDVLVKASACASELLFWSCHVDRLTLHAMCKAARQGGGAKRLERLRVMGEGANISAKGSYKAPRAHFPGRLKTCLAGGGTIVIEEDETPFGIDRFHTAFPRVRTVVIESFTSDAGVQTWQGESVQAFSVDTKLLLTADERQMYKDLPLRVDNEPSEEELALVFGARKRTLDAAAAKGEEAVRELGVIESVVSLPHLTPAKLQRISVGMWTLQDLTLSTTVHVANPLALVANDAGVAHLAALPHLRRLVLRDLPGVRGTGLLALAANDLPLEELEIAIDAPRGTSALLHKRAYLNDDGAEAISELQHLRRLTLVNPVMLSDAGVATFACLPNLTELCISGASHVEGNGFGAFNEDNRDVDLPVSKLHTLELSDAPIADFAAADLPANVTRGVTNDGLAALGSIPGLTSLSLSSARATAAGVDVLLHKATSLKTLVLHDSTISHRVAMGFAESAMPSDGLESLTLSLSESDRPAPPSLPEIGGGTRKALARRFPNATITVKPAYALRT